MQRLSGLALCAALSAPCQIAAAQSMEFGGKLPLTRGISTVEGVGGGGLVPWALITGNETDRGIGGSAHITAVTLPDYELFSYGVAAGFYDRVEVSYTRQEFNTGDTGPKLGLPQDFKFGQEVYGAKLRVAGDAVYDQDRILPQISVGMFYKAADHDDLLSALGAEEDSGVEVYASATKLYLSQSLLLGGTLRYTEANQTGLLGFGGQDSGGLYPEVSVGYMLGRRLIVGGEYRAKPDNLAFAEENDWLDLFAAYAVTDNLTVTAAYADIGSVATFDDQRGLYLSLQAGF